MRKKSRILAKIVDRASPDCEQIILPLRVLCNESNALFVRDGLGRRQNERGAIRSIRFDNALNARQKLCRRLVRNEQDALACNIVFKDGKSPVRSALGIDAKPRGKHLNIHLVLSLFQDQSSQNIICR